MNDVITDPEKYQKGWTGGLPETPCGFGSKLRTTKVQRAWIPAIVKQYGIKSIADIGAGDLNWSSRTVFGCKYTAYDLIPRKPDVIKLDILTDKLPGADCLMVLWVINHFPPDMQKLAIDRLLSSGSRYLMMTWDNRMQPYTDIKPIETEVLRHSKGVNFEIRLIELN